MEFEAFGTKADDNKMLAGLESPLRAPSIICNENSTWFRRGLLIKQAYLLSNFTVEKAL